MLITSILHVNNNVYGDVLHNIAYSVSIQTVIQYPFYAVYMHRNMIMKCEFMVPISWPCWWCLAVVDMAVKSKHHGVH